MSIDLLTGDLHNLDNDGLYKAIVAFVDAQPNEGWRHDFTEQWDESALTKAAAFANSFGGVVIVGVRKNKSDLTPTIAGVPTKIEYTTRIASSIAANISPTPLYDVFECHAPDEPGIRFCVVRVRSGQALYLITKKGVPPVYVRNVDEARPADAAQIRALVDREKEARAGLPQFAARAERLRDALIILRRQKRENDGMMIVVSSRDPRQSDTFLKAELIPNELRLMELDGSHEDRFRSLVKATYPRISVTVDQVAGESVDRGRDYFEYAWYHSNLDFEARWRITECGDLGVGSQVEYYNRAGPGEWSVVDLAVQLILFTRLAVDWWQYLGYFGDGRLVVQLSVQELGIARAGRAGAFVRGANLMHPVANDLAIPADAVHPATSPRSSSNAEVSWNYFQGSNSAARITTSVLNQLLRGLGHAVRWDLLESAIAEIARR